MSSLKNLFVRVFDLICFVLAVLFSFTVALLAVPLFWIHPSLGQVMHKTFGRGWLWLMAVDLQIVNPERLPKMGVLAANHQSMFDIPVLSSLPVPFKWLSKKEVKRIPFIGWAMQAMGCYFVARDRSGRDLNIMKGVEEDLKKGNCVAMFPEGTRTRTGELLPFKKGAFMTALNAGVPLVPIAISGTRPIAPPGKIPSRNHRVIVRVGQPYLLKAGEPMDQVMLHFRRELVELLDKNKQDLQL